MRCKSHFKSCFGNVKAFNLKKLKLSLSPSPLTRSKSLSKMMRIVINERFTIEIDSENALLNSTWNAEDSPSSAFQFSTTVSG